ncbi:MAG: GTP-binding protein [Methylovulum miyakonense]|uniref:CobW family GTP-binding protein n=1 Tax=Methylovulum miyakonense TaxID=645578 RepID=UPI003BB5AFA2
MTNGIGLGSSPQIGPRIPVTLLSGFLGSGKTTLLNRLLSQAPRSAVIINEFGSTPIDQQLLREHNIPLSTLAGGCLCCQVVGSLAPLLKNLRMAWDAHPSGSSHGKPFDRVFIETSGVANPAPVLDILLRERWLAARYRLDGIITMVSAAQGVEALSRFPEAQAQVVWADALVVTQADLATAGQIGALTEQLGRLAPATPCLRADQGAIGLEALMAFVRPEAPRLKKVAPIPGHSFHSVCVQLGQPLVWGRLRPVLASLLNRYPGQLVRLKGVVYTLDGSGPLVVQGVAGTLFPPVRLPATAADDGRGRLVFITDGEIPGLPHMVMEMIRAGA